MAKIIIDYSRYTYKEKDQFFTPKILFLTNIKKLNLLK